MQRLTFCFLWLSTLWQKWKIHLYKQEVTLKAGTHHSEPDTAWFFTVFSNGASTDSVHLPCLSHTENNTDNQKPYSAAQQPKYRLTFRGIPEIFLQNDSQSHYSWTGPRTRPSFFISTTHLWKFITVLQHAGKNLSTDRNINTWQSTETAFQVVLTTLGVSSTTCGTTEQSWVRTSTCWWELPSQGGPSPLFWTF